VKHRKRQPSRTKYSAKQRVILKVYTGGEKTEVDYIKYWHRIFRERVNVIIDTQKQDHGVPLTLANRALKEKKDDTRDSRRSDTPIEIYYWCVFDVDNHPNLRQAIQKAETNCIRVAVSNPCIELWFLLHFQEQEGFINRYDSQHKSKEYLKCGKNLNNKALQLLEGRFPEAKERAINLQKKHRVDGRRHEADGSSWRSNPSSDLFELIDQISGQDH